jgi:hypothetical protein
MVTPAVTQSANSKGLGVDGAAEGVKSLFMGVFFGGGGEMAAMALDKHFFQAGGFDLLEFLELDGVLGNQLV